MKWNATILLSPFQSTRTDQNSSTEFYEIFSVELEHLARELNYKGCSFFFSVTYYTGRNLRFPFQFFGIQTFFEKLRPKENRRPEPRKHTKDLPFGYLGVFNLDFFGTSKSFWLHQRVLLQFFDILQQNGCLKIREGPLLARQFVQTFGFFGYCRRE